MISCGKLQHGRFGTAGCAGHGRTHAPGLPPPAAIPQDCADPKAPNRRLCAASAFDGVPGTCATADGDVRQGSRLSERPRKRPGTPGSRQDPRSCRVARVCPFRAAAAKSGTGGFAGRSDDRAQVSPGVGRARPVRASVKRPIRAFNRLGKPCAGTRGVSGGRSRGRGARAGSPPTLPPPPLGRVPAPHATLAPCRQDKCRPRRPTPAR